MQRSAAQAGGDAGAGASLNLSLRGKVAKGRTGTGTTLEPQPTASSARARRPKPRPARPHVFSALGLVTLVGRLDCIGHRCWGRFWIGFVRRRRSDTLVRRLRRLRRWRGSHPRQLWEGVFVHGHAESGSIDVQLFIVVVFFF